MNDQQRYSKLKGGKGKDIWSSAAEGYAEDISYLVKEKGVPVDAKVLIYLFSFFFNLFLIENSVGNLLINYFLKKIFGISKAVSFSFSFFFF